MAPDVLRPLKKITDPVHGEVYLTALEVAVLDSKPMQRLRRVRQLGTTHLVYPGATHTRFSHSLGALRVAQDLMDVALAQGLGPHRVEDLFGEWQSKLPEEYERMVGQATVLARLGALLHDLGHVPFGHTLEEDLGILERHDENEQRFEGLWQSVLSDLQERRDLAPGGITLPEGLSEQLKPLILSEWARKAQIPQTYPFVADIVGNTICADLIDYLQRDHRYTGLPAGFGHRFLDGFYVTKSDHPYQPERMVIQINRAGRPRADVVSELLKYLRYRYELSERALVHHAKLAADVMIGKVMQMWRDALESESGSDAAIGAIESQMLRRGDDGLLEHLLDEAEQRPEDSRWRGIGEIASQLQSRRLFKLAGVYRRRAKATDLYKAHGTPAARAELERDAARYAGAEHGWMVAVWIPDPNMRFKPAGVLVDDGNETEIVDLAAWDLENGRRGSEIIESHLGLWAVRVYVDSRLSKEQRAVVLARLQAKLGINGWDGESRTLARIAAERVCAEKQLPATALTELTESAEPLSTSHQTFEDLVQALGDSTSSVRLRRLHQWRQRGSISIEHPDLEAKITSASDSVVTLDGVECDVTSEKGVVRLNLALFVRDLPDDVFEAPEGRGRVLAHITGSPDDFEARVLDQLPSSAPARRQGSPRATGGSALTELAVELAIREFLSSDAPDRLL